MAPRMIWTRVAGNSWTDISANAAITSALKPYESVPKEALLIEQSRQTDRDQDQEQVLERQLLLYSKVLITDVDAERGEGSCVFPDLRPLPANMAIKATPEFLIPSRNRLVSP